MTSMTDPYYSDEYVTLYHGDCREITAWLKADVLVTDPPYGIRYVNGGARINAQGVRSVSRERLPVHNDADTSARDAVLIAWGDRPALVFGTWKVQRPACTQRLLWIKENTTPCLGATPWSSADEEIYAIGEGWVGPRSLNYLVTTEARAGIGGLAAQIGHPTPKPLGLMRDLIRKCPSGVLADPFAGSGSTLLAAKDLGRQAIGVEIDERYCEIAAKRLAQGVLDFGEAS